MLRTELLSALPSQKSSLLPRPAWPFSRWGKPPIESQIGQPDASSVLLGLGGGNAGSQAVVFKDPSL